MQCELSMTAAVPGGRDSRSTPLTSTARGTRCRTRTRGARDDAVHTYRGASPYTYAHHGMRRREPPQRYLPDEEATRPRTSTTVRTLHPLRATKWLWLIMMRSPLQSSSLISHLFRTQNFRSHGTSGNSSLEQMRIETRLRQSAEESQKLCILQNPTPSLA